jgi:hypothetical protein
MPGGYATLRRGATDMPGGRSAVVAWSRETGQASWIGPRLSPFGADRADSVIPAGFDTYARLLHPVWRYHEDSGEERVVRWGEVAAWSGFALDRLAQFHDIALPRQAPAAPAPWDSQGPAEGTLPGPDAAVLAELLAGHTATPDRCWFCLWDGYGWQHPATSVTVTAGEGPAAEPPDLPEPLPAWVATLPRVHLPQRDYLLYTGAVSAALAFVEGEEQTPNLWWPDDRPWCVASEIDLPWTYLAGPSTLIEAVLGELRLEALPARDDDPMQFRVHGWLVDTIAAAATELAESGAITVTTPAGSVHAHLTRPTPEEQGWLHTDYESAGGDNSGSSSGSAIETTSEDELLKRLRLHLSG